MKSQLTGLCSLLFFLATYAALAQTSPRKPDKIYKLDQTAVEGLIEEVNKSEVQYKKVNDPKGPLFAIPRKEIWKIVWNNSEVEQINDPSQPQPKTQKPTDLLVRKKDAGATGWDGSGFYAGAQLGAGISMAPSSEGLKSGAKPGIAGGLTIGYHKQGLGIRLQANYTQVSYGIAVPDLMGDRVSAVTGGQSQLMVPLTIIAAGKLRGVRITGALGAFGTFQLGSGFLDVEEQGTSPARVKNCETCYSKDPGLGVTGGIGIRFIEKSTHALFVEANWYHQLGDNKDYVPGEKSVNTHMGLLSAGVLLRFPK